MRYADCVKRALLLVVLAATAACNKGNAAKLEGRWMGVKATGVSGDQLAAANLFASKMQLDFHGHVVSVHVGDDKQSSPFHVVSDAANQLVLSDDADGSQAKETFTFADDKTLDWTVMPGKTIQFVKQ